ncbi:lytic transglycosylase domain-containing protein [Clostridium sp.]|uniref:lytic transglycosylase domain-containing protein n=1 Tax=Clostridium sp. TaxID=1506 RepID=UPI0034647B7D
MKHMKNIALVLAILILSMSIMYFAIKIIYPLKYKDTIVEYSKKYDLDPYFVAAVIKAESGFRPNVKSHKNAVGLMQLTDSTAEWVAKEMGMSDFKLEDLKTPEINIAMGCWYLENLNKEFKYDKTLVLAAYNAGRGNVNKWLKDDRYSKDGTTLDFIPFKETDKYIKKVEVNYKIYKFIYKDLGNE